VAAETELVRPPTQPQALQPGVVAQLPSRAHQAANVRADRKRIQFDGVGDAPVQRGAEGLGALGRVLGDVAGDRLGR
jgi:hypothetical protein